MNRFKQILECGALIALTVAMIGLIAIEGSLRKALPDILASAARGAAKFADASDALNTAAQNETKYLANGSRELNKTVADAHDLLIHTDLSLNGPEGLLPTQTKQLALMESQANQAIADLDAAVKQAQPILANLSVAAFGASQAANDPNIAKSLAGLAEATRKANIALLNLDAISASGNRDAQALEARLKQVLKPASLLKTALYRALGIAVPAAEIAGALR
jgi:hypothetical protein